jgi:hypothetical protein
VNVRLTQIDGKLPNLALMKLAHYHLAHGDDIHFTRNARRDMFEPVYDVVYGSAIFTWSRPTTDIFLKEFPNAILGGTGAEDWRQGEYPTVEQFLGVNEYEQYDYSGYPGFTGSIGFTARGCRLKCGFCIVPKKEGRPRSVNAIADIWRGEGHPRHIHLLDNDFFGQPREQWEARVREMIDGEFRVCFNQGINVRMVDKQSAEVLASLQYYDDAFKSRRLYTAWDNLKDEPIFIRGVEQLIAAGINPDHILVYMLVGYDPAETWERIFYRFNRMVEMGLRPYPMVFNNSDVGLKKFQRYAIRRFYHLVSFDEYLAANQHPEARKNLHDRLKAEAEVQHHLFEETA